MRKNRLEKGCTVYEISWLFLSLSRNVCFSCAQNCVSLGAKRKMKNKKRERKAESGLVITYIKKKAVAVLPDCVFIPCYFPFSLSLFFKLLRYFSCWFSATRGSSTRNPASSLIHADSSRSLLADPARHHRLRLHKRQVRAIPYSCATFQKKKGAQHFQAKTRYQRARVEKAGFFFRKKVTNQLRPQFTFVFIVVTVLLLMMLYFSSSFLFKSLPTSTLMLTARCTLIKRLTKKRALGTAAIKMGEKKRRPTLPLFPYCVFFFRLDLAPPFSLSPGHTCKKLHIHYLISLFFFCVYSPLKARQQEERENQKNGK